MKTIEFNPNVESLSDKELLKKVREFAKSKDELLVISNGTMIYFHLLLHNFSYLGFDKDDEICFITEYGEKLYSKNLFCPYVMEGKDSPYYIGPRYYTVSPILNARGESIISERIDGGELIYKDRLKLKKKKTLVIQDSAKSYNDYELIKKIREFVDGEDEFFFTSSGALAITEFESYMYKEFYPLDYSCIVFYEDNIKVETIPLRKMSCYGNKDNFYLDFASHLDGDLYYLVKRD